MTSRAQNARSSLTLNRPPNTRPVGEFYVNFADNQLGVIDPTPAARDLLPIRTHAPTASFATGDLVSSGGRLYRAKAVMSPKAFAYADWLGISDEINILDFGAKIDGVTLDGPAIGAALAALKPYQSVFFPGGQSNFLWANVQGTTPTTPVLFRLDGTTNPSGTPYLRAFSRLHKGDVFETFYNGMRYFSKRDPELDSQGVILVEHYNDSTSGGSGGAISIPVYVAVRDNAAAVTSMWGVHVAIDSYSNQIGWPQNVGVSSSLHKHGCAWATAIHVTSQDDQQLPSSTGGNLLGMELGHHADLADDSFNGGIFGNKGTRQGIGIRQSAVNAGLGLAEFSVGIVAGSDSTSITKSCFMSGLGGYAYQVFDSRGPLPPPAYPDPLAGLRMLHEQIIDFNGGPQQDSRAGNYLQYTTSGTARLRYMDGAAELWAISDSGAWSGSSFGTAPGQLPVFENNAGFAQLSFPTRFIVNKSGTTSGTDFTTVQINRTTNHTGGAGGAVATALRVGSTLNPGVTNQEWAILGTATSNSTVAGGLVVGGDFQGIRIANSPTPIWGGIFNAIDQSGTASSVTPGAVLAGEIDIRATGADDGLNAAMFGGKGLRVGLQFVLVRQLTTANLEASHGLWFSAPELTNSKWFSAVGFQVGLRTHQALDTRGAISPDANPMAAVRMLAGQIIDLNGGPQLDSAPGAYLQYRSGKLYYVVAGVDKWSVDATGNMRCAGTVTPSVTP